MRPVILILPARDEALTIGELIARVPPAVHGHPVEVIVVDDGSRDATAAIARLLGVHVVAHGSGRGLGAAIRTGLAAASARRPAAVAFCDADGEYAPEELADLVEPILAGRADYVVGSRFAGRIDRMLWRRRIGNIVLTRTLRTWSGVKLTDGQSGYRALSAGAARAARISHDYNYAQILTCDLLAQGFRYAEVPISYAFREHGRSFVRPLPYLRRVIPALWRQRRDLRASRPAHTGGVVPRPH
jgi:glycosyltransferase involved in cell wall biosynthesis